MSTLGKVLLHTALNIILGLGMVLYGMRQNLMWAINGTQQVIIKPPKQVMIYLVVIYGKHMEAGYDEVW